MKYDYIVVGFGIAGMSITYQLKRAGKSVLVIDGNIIKASHVAAGMFNPVILKRFSLAWRADELLTYAKVFYNDLSNYLSFNTCENLSIYRRFHNVEEQNNWFSAIDNPRLSQYLSPYLKKEATNAIEAPFQYGEVMQTGRFLVKEAFDHFRQKLVEENSFLNEEIDFTSLYINDQEVLVNGYTASRVIFCEGHQMLNNPFFNYLPLSTNRGAYLVFRSEGMLLNVAIKSHFFLIPLGNHTYKFGATYQNHLQIKNGSDSELEKNTLINELEKLINVPYQIVDFVVGVRPTVKDRRPLVGKHPKYNRLFVFNGLGTRGVTLAPDTSRRLFDYLENSIDLLPEINIDRYSDIYDQT